MLVFGMFEIFVGVIGVESDGVVIICVMWWLIVFEGSVVLVDFGVDLLFVEVFV